MHSLWASTSTSARQQLRRLLADALCCGSVASVLSTLVVSMFSRQRTGHAAAGTNAASQWIWYPQARARFATSWRHTATGYLIHHASSVFWATGYQLLRPDRAGRGGQAMRAAAIATAAYRVDYHVVPRRLSPGFEGKIGVAGMWATYAAFGLGLVLGSRPGRGDGPRRGPRSMRANAGS